MKQTSVITRRFAELDDQAKQVEASKRNGREEFYESLYVDNDLLLNWAVKARHLISLACGESSEHYRSFVLYEKGGGYRTNHDIFRSLLAIFSAAREDFEGGYLTRLRSLVQAEVFDSELDQAKALLNAGYRLPAAVVAGTVLETSLRQICADSGIALTKDAVKLDRMNAELAKAGVYNLLRQKRITALAELRNNAAHGHADRFGADDVSDMISEIERFLSEYL